VPVANPARATALIQFAAMVARAHEGEVVLLHVITVPRQTPLDVGRRFIREAYEEVVDEATAAVEARGVRSSSLIRIAHRPADAILHEVEDSAIDMVVMGWRGESRNPRTALGSNLDWVMRVAPAEVVVLRADHLRDIRSVLVPVAYPRQAHALIRIAELFEQEGAALDLLHVAPPGQEPEARKDRMDELYEGLADVGVGPPGSDAGRPLRILEETDIVAALVREAATHDLTMVGAAREGPLRRLVMGSRPEQLATQSPGRLLLYKQRRNPIHSRLLDTIDFFRGVGTPGAREEEPVEAGERP
jgi:nucleotide-binding universal stress UspA family protein